MVNQNRDQNLKESLEPQSGHLSILTEVLAEVLELVPTV